MTGRWPSPLEVARLQAVVDEMPEPRRSVYLLCARDGLDYGRIGKRLGLPVGRVERYLAEALVDLMTALDGEGDAPSLLQ
jgi:DNA-directed RNA polymerase specialized sigma24 family protein